MNLLYRLISFLAYSNSWIGLGAAAFLWQYYLIYDLECNWQLIGFAFFATVLTYTFQRYYKIISDGKTAGRRMLWMKENPNLIKGIMITSGLGCLPLLWGLSWSSYLLLFGCGLLSLFYVIKIPGKISRNLRDIPSLKIFLIGLVWAATSTLLPYLNQPAETVEVPWLFFIADFIFVAAITIPFDIRDIILDETEKKTIPQLLGERNSLWVASFMLVLNYALLLLTADQFLAFTLTALSLSIIFVRASSSDTGDIYFSFFIDGLLILQPTVVFMDLILLKNPI
ncbi:MAG: hypothetical protein P8I55_06880 [Crocinitomix sp.]|nr:hypothetical protein [Crocinitomix sp.]